MTWWKLEESEVLRYVISCKKETSKSGFCYVPNNHGNIDFGMILNWILILFQHGPISNQGLLLCTGDAICYKKFSKKISTKKKKSRECMVFIFRETVIICDKVRGDQPYSPQLFNYWISFQVHIYSYAFINYKVQMNLDLRNCELRKIVATNKILVHKLFDHTACFSFWIPKRKCIWYHI